MNLALAHEAPVTLRHEVGGGDSLAGAIAAARDPLPAGLDWELVRWNHLYGD
jgi:hypothetical protein